MKMIKNKTVTIIGALILVFMLVMPADVFSQGPPPWAPAHGYRAKTRHIYFPDHNFYFDLQKKVYIYVNGGKWQVGIRLPSIFGTINLGKSTQIQLDYFGSYPQYFNSDHKIKYKYKKKQKNAPNYKSKPKFKDTNNGRKDKENDNRGKGNKGKGNDK